MADNILDDYRAARPDLANLSDQELIGLIHQASGVGGSPRDYARNYLGIKNDAGFAQDTARDVAKGVVGLGQIATGVGNLATGGALGRGIRNTFGGDLTDVQNKISQGYSDARQDSDAAVQAANGFWNSVKAVATHPRTAVGGAVEALPSMLLPGGVAGKVTERALAGAEGVAGATSRSYLTKEALQAADVAGNRASSATWAGMTAAQTADKINHDQPDNVAGMYEGALGTGAVVGALTHGFSFLPGGHMADQAASTGKRLGLSMANQATMMGTMGAAQTGAENLATGQPFDHGMAASAASGLLSGAGFGVMGARLRPDHAAAGQASSDAAARVAVGDTEFESKWNEWAADVQAQQQAAVQAKTASVQPTVEQSTGVSRPPVPNNEESMRAALDEPSALWGQDPATGHEHNLTTGDLQQANVDPQAQRVVDPAAAQLAATQQQAKGKEADVPPVTQEERNAVFAKYGESRPNYIEGKLDQHGHPLAVGQHFDDSAVPDKNGNVRPYLSPDKLSKAVEKLALADRDKPEGQRAAEQQLSDVFNEALGRRPTSKEVTKIANTIDLAHATSKEQLVGHIDAALAGMEGLKKPDTVVQDALTAWRKALDPDSPSAVKVAEPKAEGEAKPAEPVKPVEPAHPVVQVLQEIVKSMKPQGKDAVAFTDAAGKTVVKTRAAFLDSIANLKGKERERFNMLMGLDDEGNPVGSPMTHAQIASAESTKYGKPVGATAIGNWAKKMGLSQEVVDRATAHVPEEASPEHTAEFLAPDAGHNVVDNVGDIHKGGLGTQDLTPAQLRQQQVADELLAKNRTKLAEKAPEPESPEIVAKREAAARNNRMMGFKLAADSPHREAAMRTFNAMRRKGQPRFDELSEDNRAAWILAYDQNERNKLHDHPDILDSEFAVIIKEEHNGQPADRSEQPGLHGDSAGDLQPPAARPESGGALPAVDGASGQADGAVPKPAVVVKKRRVVEKPAEKVQEAAGGRNPDVAYNRLTPVTADSFATATDAAHWVRDNTTNPFMRMVATKIAPFLKDVEFHVHQHGEQIDARLASRFARGSMGLTVVHSDGKVSVHMVAKDVNPNSMTHETLLHELVHAATMKRLENQSVRIEVAKLADQVATVMRTRGDEFFHQREIFGSPDEFMAYGLTSPTFQHWMQQMDANGRLKSSKGPHLSPVPEPTMWQKFVDMVRKMFGLAPAFKENIERVLEVNRKVTEHYENDSLETKMQQMLDKVLATPEHSRYDQPQEKVLAASEAVSAIEIRRTAEERVKALPPRLQKPVRGIVATVHDVTTRGAQAMAFMHDLADWGAKHGLPAMQDIAGVMAKKGAYKVELDQKLGSVVKRFQGLPKDEQAKVQEFIKDSTFEQRWGFEPDWKKDAQVNPEAKAQYEALSPEGQKVAVEVFRHGADTRAAKIKALTDIIQSHYTELVSRADAKGEDTAALWKQMEQEVKKAAGKEMDGPYAPLRRFGDQAVTVKSKALLEAKETQGSQYRTMLDDPQHYRVEFHHGVYAAENRRAELQDELGDSHVVERSAKEKHEYLGAGYETLNRLAESMKAQFDGKDYSDADRNVAHATYRAIQEAIIQSLGEHNARTSTLQRKYIAGVKADEMMRGFATQGYADNAFLANMLHSRELNDHMANLRAQKDAGGDRAAKQNFYNELQARRAANLQADTPRWVGTAMRFNTVWKLITSPAYYLQYLSQPLTMFLPLVNGDHGYGAGTKALLAAIKDTAALSKGLFDTNIDGVRDPGERKMLQELRSAGTIAIGHEQQFGHIQTLPQQGISKVWNSATDKLTMLPHSVEMHNRIASALAAYRLEMAKHGDSAKATAYARDMINQAYGDYSSFNAPRIMQGGAITKLLMQYRQFQLIHTALLVRLMGNAFAGESPDVRRAAKLQLGYMAGHYGVLAGALGIPAAHLLGGAIKTVFGDDTDVDTETFVKRHTGNKFVADMILGGVPRAVFGQDLSHRMGAGDILSPFKYTDMGEAIGSKKGYKDFTVAAMGPFIGGLVPQMVDGVDMIQHGDYYRGLEQLMPKGVADVMKAYEFSQQGVQDRKGATVVKKDEFGAGDVLAQALGSRPTAISDPQHDAAVVGKLQQQFKDEANSLKSQFVRARKGDGDTNGLVEKWREMMDKQREMGMKPQPLSELYKAPAQMGKRDSMAIDGVQYRKTTRGLVEDVTGNKQ